jgi:hypothetical protein
MSRFKAAFKAFMDPDASAPILKCEQYNPLNGTTINVGNTGVFNEGDTIFLNSRKQDQRYRVIRSLIEIEQIEGEG